MLNPTFCWATPPARADHAFEQRAGPPQARNLNIATVDRPPRRPRPPTCDSSDLQKTTRSDPKASAQGLSIGCATSGARAPTAFEDVALIVLLAACFFAAGGFMCFAPSHVSTAVP